VVGWWLGIGGFPRFLPARQSAPGYPAAYLSLMRKGTKELFVVGDRVLVRAEEGEERTNVGLYLPPTAVDSQAVQGGTIVATGPGLPMPSLDANSEEPWQTQARETRFLPMQAKRGDFALFFRKAAVEITFEGSRYLVIPQTAILALVRDELAELGL
jgi:chaperonin GroES